MLIEDVVEDVVEAVLDEGSSRRISPREELYDENVGC